MSTPFAPRANAFTMSVPPSHAAIDEDGGATIDGLGDLGKRVDAGDRGVELAATVVRDDHAADAALDGTLGVVASDDSLHEDGEAGQRREPLDVVPGQAGVEDGGEELEQPRVQTVRPDPRKAPREVRGGEALGQRETVGASRSRRPRSGASTVMTIAS